jgi:hypothetical protein
VLLFALLVSFVALDQIVSWYSYNQIGHKNQAADERQDRTQSHPPEKYVVGLDPLEHV